MCIKSCGGETQGNETNWKTRRLWEDNIKADTQEVEWGYGLVNSG